MRHPFIPQGYTYIRDAGIGEAARWIIRGNTAIRAVNEQELDRSRPAPRNEAGGVEFGLVLRRTRVIWISYGDEMALVTVNGTWSLWGPGLFNYQRCEIPIENVERVRLYRRAAEAA